MRRYVLALLLVAVASGMPAQEKENGIVGSVLGAVKECVDGDVSLCLKVRTVFIQVKCSAVLT